ncbi:MAG: D-cysteine desulfhydrase family protein [Lawsonibacter sp.]|nr:D-cysteine desulfhydrase family protein [Lawsonibacter sp.]
MKTIEQAQELIHQQVRVKLGFFPTPLHKLEKVSQDTGVNVYIKREDFSGMTLFGGNKMRKLEYLLGDASAKGCDTVITYGATQSNHAMETATAARKCGMNPILYLAALVEPKEEDIRANLLLDTILGAELHILPTLPGELMADTFVRCRDQVDARIAQLEQEGHTVYDMPSGGSTPVGVVGYADSFVETMGQLRAQDVHADYFFTSTGTGGTLAGLSAGKILLGSDIKVIGIQVSPKNPDSYPTHVVELANGALERIGAQERTNTSQFVCDPNYFAPGYEMPSKAANDDIRYLARSEGLFTDPVYSGKGFHGLMEYIRDGRVPKGSTVVYFHTGGTTALFSEAEIVGDLTRG